MTQVLHLCCASGVLASGITSRVLGLGDRRSYGCARESITVAWSKSPAGVVRLAVGHCGVFSSQTLLSLVS